MVEITNCPIWAHVIFGTLDGWWRFSDKERRPGPGPLLSDKVLKKKSLHWRNTNVFFFFLLGMGKCIKRGRI